MPTAKAFLSRTGETAKQLLPFLAWISELKQWRTIRGDLIAGLTVAMLLIPQSMAYAHLAGLPVHIGLYAAFIPPIVAALFGSSRILSTGPVPVTSLLTAIAMQPLAAIGTPNYLHYVLLLTLLSGFIQVALGLLRFGVVVNFISHPVILGFINAVALIIASMQLSNLFGIYAAPAPHYYETLWQVLNDAVMNTNWLSIGIAVFTFVVILGGRRFWPDLPHTLIAVVLTSAIAWAIGYEKLETIRVEQIVNLHVQNMLLSHQQYPKEMKKQLNEVSKTKALAQKAMQSGDPASEVTEQAMNEAAQARWRLEHLISRHQTETKELNRLRFHSLKTQDGKQVYFVSEEITPIGEIGTHKWRIEQILESGEITLQAGGEVVGHIPAGLPSFQWINVHWDVLSALFMPALVIALVGFTEAITIAKRIATESRQQLNINQELLGQGLAKCIGSFFQSMPVSGGFARTTVNFYAGAKTGFSSIVTGLVVMLTLLWLTPLFYYLPYATLAALIIIGVLGIIDFKQMWQIWRINRKEGVVMLATFLMTLVLAPKLVYALLLGMLLSLGVYLYETMRPRFSEITKNSDGELVEIGEENATTLCYLISLVRFHGSLYFANAAYFEEKVLNLISAKQKLRYIILDCISVNKLDASGLETLNNLCSRLEDAGIELWFTRVRQPVLTVLKRGKLYDRLGEHHFYKTNESAIAKLAGHLGAKHMNTCPFGQPVRNDGSVRQ